jgi:copper(I)-binding protein
MNPRLIRRDLLRSSLALGVALLAPSARACEFFSPTLRILHPWTRASEPGATSAVVCMRFDEVSRDDRLVQVQTPVAAAAEMGGVALAGSDSGKASRSNNGAAPGLDFWIPAGRESALSEGGRFVRLLDLRHPLEVGRSYPMTLVFEQGGGVNASLTVDFASFRFA